MPALLQHRSWQQWGFAQSYKGTLGVDMLAAMSEENDEL